MTGVELAIGLGIAGAATSVYAASEQNKAVRRAAGTTRAASELQARQLMDAAKIEQRKAALKAEQVRGRIRVAAASAGLAPDAGTYMALSQQEAIDYAMNQAIIQRNSQNQINAVLSGGAAEIARLMSQRQNMLLSSIQGGLAGAQTGLAIQGGINALNNPKLDAIGNIGGMGGEASFGGGFGPTTGGYGAPTAFA